MAMATRELQLQFCKGNGTIVVAGVLGCSYNRKGVMVRWTLWSDLV